MEFPSVRRVGFNTGFNIGPVSGELFLSNIKDLSRGGTVTGLRLAYKFLRYTTINRYELYCRWEYVFWS